MRAERSSDPLLCAAEHPGIIHMLGERAVVVHPDLAEHYYRLSCSHPATSWLFPDERLPREAAGALTEALARRDDRLERYSLQMVGILRPLRPNGRPGEHLYIRGDACAPDDSWMAPSASRPSCTFDALYARDANRFVVLAFGGEPRGACPVPARDERPTRRMPCRFGIEGTLLRRGRGTFLANAESARLLCPSGHADEHFAPDEESARAALQAVEQRLASLGGGLFEGPRRTLEEYWLQVAGEIVVGTRHGRPPGRYLYVAGACMLRTPNGWLYPYLTSVADGGTCYFDAHYDLTRGELVHFQVHGEA